MGNPIPPQPLKSDGAAGFHPLCPLGLSPFPVLVHMKLSTHGDMSFNVQLRPESATALWMEAGRDFLEVLDIPCDNHQKRGCPQTRTRTPGPAGTARPPGLQSSLTQVCALEPAGPVAPSCFRTLHFSHFHITSKGRHTLSPREN